MFEDYPALASALTKHAQPDLPWYERHPIQGIGSGYSPIRLPGSSGPGLDQQITDRTLEETWKLMKNNPVKSVAYGAGVPLAGYGLYKLLSGLGGKNPREEKEEAKIASAYPALTNAAKTAACGCGVCADCRANAGSKDNMRVQDKNPKKVPVKDYEITGEDAWKGVPNVKTKEKKADNLPALPQQHQDLNARNRDYLRQDATTQSGHSLGDGGPLTAGGISAALGIPAAAFSVGGAGMGILANLIRGKSLWRGAGTGALTGLGALAGGVGGGVAGTVGGAVYDDQGLGGPASTIGLGAGGLGGAGAGGYAGYQTAQSLFGEEEEEPKTAMLRKQAALPAITEMKVGPDGTRVPRAPAPAGPSWMQQAGDAANNAWTGGKNLFGLEQAQGPPTAGGQGPGQAIRGGSAADYSSQAGQWLADKVGYGDQFKNLGAGWQAGLPALGGAAALGLGSYGLSRLFGGSDKDKEKTSAYIARNYPTKQAGFWSELGAGLNPLNLVAGPMGAAAALTTPTRNIRDQATSNIDDTWSNLLIPGKGSYNSAKRLGWSIRGPELEAVRAAAAKSDKKQDLQGIRDAIEAGAPGMSDEPQGVQLTYMPEPDFEPKDNDPQHPGDPGFEEKLKQHMDDNNLKYSAARDLLVCANALTKQGGYWSELLSGINPLNAYGGGAIGMAAAPYTDTKSIKELGEQDTKSWSNMLLPGVGAYRIAKRLGTSIRGPEMQAMEEQIKRERAEGNPDAAPSLSMIHGKEEDENYRKAYMSEDEESEKDVAKEKAAAARYLLSSASMLTR